MVVAAEGASPDTALAVGLRVSPGSLAVTVEWPAAGTVPVESSAAVASTVSVESSAAIASTAIEGVPVIKCSAVRVVPVVVVDCVMVVPIESPTTPAPSITAEEADSEAATKREVRAAIPNAGVRIPAGPGDNPTAVDDPAIQGGDLNYPWT